MMSFRSPLWFLISLPLPTKNMATKTLEDTKPPLQDDVCTKMCPCSRHWRPQMLQRRCPRKHHSQEVEEEDAAKEKKEEIGEDEEEEEEGEAEEKEKDKSKCNKSKKDIQLRQR